MDWRDDLERYLKHLESRHWTPSSVKGARKILGGFFHFVWRTGGQDLSGPADVTPEMVESYQRFLASEKSPATGKPYSVKTQQTYLRGIRAFYNWLEARGEVLVGPASEIEVPQQRGSRVGRILSEKEAKRLIEAPNVSTPLGVRDRAILELMYSTALRVSEVLKLTIYDVDTGAGVVMVREGKGRKDRVVPLGETAAHYVTEYVTNVRTAYATRKKIASNRLFLSNVGEPMTEKALRGVVYRYASEARVKASPHAIRRSATTHMLASGASPEVLQQMLGHGDGRSLRFYARLFGPELKEEHRKAHPREEDAE